MSNGDLNWIANFIWGIADDALRDLYVRGKYRDVILPMIVIRRLDAVLEPTKKAVLSMKENLDKAGITNQDAALRQAADQAFYNTSLFTLRDLRNRASQSQLKADFEAFLMASRPTCRKFSTASNSVTKSRDSRKRIHLERSSRSSSIPR
jgi:type I restriction enzyme M protein